MVPEILEIMFSIITYVFCQGSIPNGSAFLIRRKDRGKARRWTLHRWRSARGWSSRFSSSGFSDGNLCVILRAVSEMFRPGITPELLILTCAVHSAVQCRRQLWATAQL
ncbi:uncharacterized protein LOC143359035 [Halictus rubicundus]|uniref:uncharacterized protein LOC143359035 n=1 Tax=Halictus rubicundus TaxID=77578 RepID=UPI0040358726